MSDPITVFLLDDHEIVRRGVRDLLEGEGDIKVVGEASTEAEAIGRVHALDPDVAILDVRLRKATASRMPRDPVTPPVRLPHAHVVRRRRGAVPSDHGRRRRLRAEADPLRGPRRRRAPRRRRGDLLDPAVTARVLERVRRGPEEDELIARLSPQEREVLQLLAEGLTNRQVAARLYLAEKTIKNYVTSVLSKMGMARRTEAAVYAATHLDKAKRDPDHFVTKARQASAVPSAAAYVPSRSRAETMPITRPSS